MKKGDRVEFSEDLALDHQLLRWGEPGGTEHFLHKGRFIVEIVNNEEVHLADADWDENGRITFHSTKHGHVVKGKSEIEFLRASAVVSP